MRRTARLGVVGVSILGLLMTVVGPCCVATALSCAEVAPACAAMARDGMRHVQERPCEPGVATIANACCDGMRSQDRDRTVAVDLSALEQPATTSQVHALPRPLQIVRDGLLPASSPTRFQTVLRL